MAKRSGKKINRRTFLKTTGGIIASTALFGLPFEAKGTVPKGREKSIPDEVGQKTLDLYSSLFEYSRGRTTGFSPHCINCKGNCAWQTFENEGRIVREEQVAGYPQISPHIPDANPRGCNKGAIHSQSLYEKDRLLYPMKRIGERGSSKWKRISWDDAFTEIAERIVEKLSRGDFAKIMVYPGTGILSPLKRAAGLRFGSLIGAVRYNVASPLGDMFPGATIAYGNSLIGTTSEAWYEADYLMIIGVNPMVARIPDAHYINEGKYKGNRVVTISPEYNPTARASTLWIPINVGTDSLFTASMNHVILKEKLYNEEFIKEQTDLPFLVKVKDRKLLRGSDILPWGRPDIFYLYDLASSMPVEAPGTAGSDIKSIRLGRIRPALKGRWTVKTATGEEIQVTTAFEILNKELKKFSPEETQKFTGIHPDIVYEEARHFAKSEKAIIVEGYRTHKYFWGILAMWGQALMLALTGHGGRIGALDFDNEWNLGDLGPLSSPLPPRFGSGFLGDWFDMDYKEGFLRHYDENEFKETTGFSKNEIIRLAETAVKENGFDYFGKPEIVILVGDNKFPRSSAQKMSQNAFFKTVELLVTLDFRMSSSGHYADFLLPTTTAYEGWDLRMDPGYCRFANLMSPPEGLKLPGEIKSEWEIFEGLSKKINEVSKKKGISSLEDKTFKDPKNPSLPLKRKLHTLYEDFITLEEDTTALTDRDLFGWLYRRIPPVRHQSVETTLKQGFVTLNSEAGQTSPLYPDKPFYPNEPQVYLKRPYMTLSGRQQFYIDHDIYIRLGCHVPVGKKPVRPSKFPLAFFDAHTRYAIHTTWRTMKYHQRLQRGIPYVCINLVTAEKRNIKDGDMIRVFNDIGEFKCMAKITGKIPPHSIWTEHAWEDIQFEGGKGYNNVLAPVLTPLELVGRYGHLTFSVFWDGNRIMGESSVEIEKVG